MAPWLNAARSITVTSLGPLPSGVEHEPPAVDGLVVDELLVAVSGAQAREHVGPSASTGASWSSVRVGATPPSQISAFACPLAMT